jgi:hypothetical protein
VLSVQIDLMDIIAGVLVLVIVIGYGLGVLIVDRKK